MPFCVNAAPNIADLCLLDAIAETGTLSAAGRRLGLNQTTVSRRLGLLERALSAEIFHRVDGRLEPSALLTPLLGRIAAVAGEAAAAVAALKSNREELRGRVVVSSVGMVLSNALAPRLDGLPAAARGIRIEFRAEDRSARLGAGEADIAIRLGATADDGATIKKLGALDYALIAPKGAAEPKPVVRYSDALSATPEMRALKRLRPDARVALVSDRLDVLMVAAQSFGAEMMVPAPLIAKDPRWSVTVPQAATRPVLRLTRLERARAKEVTAVVEWLDGAMKGWLAYQ